MKKALAAMILITITVFAATFAACINTTPLPIEDMAWEFLTVQDDSGNVLYCAESNAQAYPDAQVATAEVAFENDTVILTLNGEKIFQSTYFQADRDGKRTTLYSLPGDDDRYMTSSLAKTSTDRELGVLLFGTGSRVYYFCAPLID